jgi:hypothetical protein
MDVIGFLGFRARGTPSAAQLRAKQGMERACHGILFAYD